MDLSKNIEKYARLILEVGIHLQVGENILLATTCEAMPLAREISKQAYQMGADDVHIVLRDDIVKKDFLTYGSEQAIGQVPAHKVDYALTLCNQKYHRISILCDDPEILKDVDKERLGKYSKVSSTALKPVSKRIMANEVKWLVVSSPSEAWAKSVFPELSPEQAIDKLWQNIFKATRVDLEDPVKEWQDHDQRLKKYEHFLNQNHFEKLHYQADGTDLEVYLNPHHVWVGGSAKSADGDVFMANIPTEEVFTMPHAFKVNGVLSSTKPLFYMGNIIDQMTFRFQDGKVVDYEAKVGKDVLDIMMGMDEGARRLGEVAIVQDDSPISNTGILFKETLFDENASCHFAFGNAYTENIDYAEELTSEVMKKVGMNESIIHVDFMVGGPSLTIDGYKADGTKITLLKDGNWVI